jgi:hypothetical protein
MSGLYFFIPTTRIIPGNNWVLWNYILPLQPWKEVYTYDHSQRKRKRIYRESAKAFQKEI